MPSGSYFLHLAETESPVNQSPWLGHLTCGLGIGNKHQPSLMISVIFLSYCPLYLSSIKPRPRRCALITNWKSRWYLATKHGHHTNLTTKRGHHINWLSATGSRQLLKVKGFIYVHIQRNKQMNSFWHQCGPLERTEWFVSHFLW